MANSGVHSIPQCNGYSLLTPLHSRSDYHTVHFVNVCQSLCLDLFKQTQMKVKLLGKYYQAQILSITAHGDLGVERSHKVESTGVRPFKFAYDFCVLHETAASIVEAI